MAFELVGARLLMPLFGMGIEVWAAVIAISLGALAVGYWAGGKIADARPSTLTLAVTLLLAGISLLCVQVLGRTITSLFKDISTVAGAWCSALSILAAPLFLFGMVPPTLARLLVSTTGQTGTVVGSLMAVGTVGSVVGTTLTGLLLIPYLGVSKTLLILMVGTAAFVIVLLVSRRRWMMAAASLCIAVGMLGAGSTLKIAPGESGPMHVLEDVEGLYGYLEVLEYHGTRALVCNGIFQTVLPISGLGITKGTLIRGRDYTELIPYFRPKTRTALLIGVGGALHEQALALYGVKVHGVEIEPAVIPLAAKYFNLAAEVTVADGRAFLVRDQHRFDAIIIDAFLGGAVPEHLYTKEAFELIDEHLNPDGVLAIRLIGHPKHTATRAVARTLEAVFPHTLVMRSGIGNELQHVYLFASNKAIELGSNERLELEDYGFTGEESCTIKTKGAPLLTDDKSGLTLLSRDIMAQHRKNSLKLRRNPLW